MISLKAIKEKNPRSSLIALVVICLITILMFSTASASGSEEHGVITMKVKTEKMTQNQPLPGWEVEVKCTDGADAVLDTDKNLTVKGLADSLTAGTGYTVKCEADGTAEGKFPVEIILDDTIRDQLDNEWLGKVRIEIENADLTVKNQFGEWDGGKFKSTDGTYLENTFVESKGRQYYLGADQNKVTGWQDINSYRYYFDEKGIMQTGWYEEDGAKYFLDSDGKMHVGWYEENGVKYYFGNDGKMVTGEQQVGTKKCVFDEDGKLESEEDSLDPDRPMIALTFDDGPGKRTMDLLNVLEQYGAHATFYMQGKNVGSYPEAVAKMEAIGCETGSHSWDHPQLTKLDAAGIQQQVSSTNEAVKAIVGHNTTTLRPPYGAINDTVKANVGEPMILWSIDTLDWKTKSKDATVQSVLTTAGDGDVVLLHDIHDWSVDAAIELIPQLVANGYQLVTVSELAEARGVTLQNGETYTAFYKK